MHVHPLCGGVSFFFLAAVYMHGDATCCKVEGASVRAQPQINRSVTNQQGRTQGEGRKGKKINKMTRWINLNKEEKFPVESKVQEMKQVWLPLLSFDAPVGMLTTRISA